MTNNENQEMDLKKDSNKDSNKDLKKDLKEILTKKELNKEAIKNLELAVDLEPLKENDGQVGPYSQSGLKSAVGTKRNPLAIKPWYTNNIKKISSNDTPVITAYHPQLAFWLKMIKGLDPQYKVKQSEIELTKVIPRVSMSSSFPPWAIPQGTYWIDYESLTASTSKLPTNTWIKGLKSKFPEGSKLILGNISNINSRLAIWRFRKEIWDHELMQEFDYIVVPDLSSYLDDPRPQAAIGERMTQMVLDLGYAHGKNMIPIISWQDRTALRRQVDLLGANYPNINTIYIELTSTGTRRAPWLFSRFDDIEKYLSHLPIHFLFSGVDSGWAIRELHRIFPNGNFSLVTIWPFMKTGFMPGTKTQKAVSFRKYIRQLEDFHNQKFLPVAKTRPDDMTILEEED